MSVINTEIVSQLTISNKSVCTFARYCYILGNISLFLNIFDLKITFKKLEYEKLVVKS